MVILAGDIVYTIFGLFMHLIMRPLGGYSSFDEGKIQLNDGRVFLTADADARWNQNMVIPPPSELFPWFPHELLMEMTFVSRGVCRSVQRQPDVVVEMTIWKLVVLVRICTSIIQKSKLVHGKTKGPFSIPRQVAWRI